MTLMLSPADAAGPSGGPGSPWSDAGAARSARALALGGGAVVLVYLAVMWVDAAHRAHFHTGDTDALILGARQVADCVHLGQFRGCGRTPGSNLTSVGPYPLLQYLPAVFMVKLKFSNETIFATLGHLNLVAFAATLVLTLVALRPLTASQRRARTGFWAFIAVAALLGSSATYQATAGFGEMLAASAVMAAVAAAAHRRPLLLAATAALAATGKETMFPFVILLCVLAARRDGERVPPARLVVALGAGSAAGVAANVAFNVFRFDSLRNVAYLDPLLRTPGLGRKLEFLAAGWLSPSAGIAGFWPLTAALLGVLAVLVLVAAARRRPWATWLPSALALGTILAFTAGLAWWFSPFGWVAYGPRLAVPLLPGGLVVALLCGGQLLMPAVRRLAAWRPVGRATLGGLVLVLAAGGAVVAGWPQYGAPWSWSESVQTLSTGDATCPGLVQVVVQNDKAQYYRCVSRLMWRIRPAPLADAARGGDGWVWQGRVLAASASALLLAAGLIGIVGTGVGAGPVGRARHDGAPPQDDDGGLVAAGPDAAGPPTPGS